MHLMHDYASRCEQNASKARKCNKLGGPFQLSFLSFEIRVTCRNVTTIMESRVNVCFGVCRGLRCC